MFLHRNDILHRDLKPENIFLSYVFIYFYNKGSNKISRFYI